MDVDLDAMLGTRTIRRMTTYWHWTRRLGNSSWRTHSRPAGQAAIFRWPDSSGGCRAPGHLRATAKRHWVYAPLLAVRQDPAAVTAPTAQFSQIFVEPVRLAFTH